MSSKFLMYSVFISRKLPGNNVLVLRSLSCLPNLSRNDVQYVNSYLKYPECYTNRFKVRVREFHCCRLRLAEEKSALVKLDEFDHVTNKNKETFLDMIKLYEGRTLNRRGHVDFILAALKHVEDFGVEKDLQVYKALIDVLPKGKFIPQNIFQVEFMHYPKQQQCAIDVLEKMEINGVIPDSEMETMLLNIFGKYGFPLRKFWRMMYWLPKFKNLSPWPVPNPPPDNSLELAQLAIHRITSVDLQTKVEVYQASDVKDSLDKTWIVSGQSLVQQDLLKRHPVNTPIYVEGSYKVWLRNRSVNYFQLKADTKPVQLEPLDTDDITNIKTPFTSSFHGSSLVPLEEEYRTVHEQDDGTILGVCATGTSSRDSLLSWIRLLQSNNNPVLETIPVLFRLRSPSGALVLHTDEIVRTS